MEEVKIPYEVMCLQLSKMSKAEIQRHLEILGCTWSYNKIKEELQFVLNDLYISDRIFKECKICDVQSPYTVDFIDEVVLEITKRETFSFVHYGKISTAVDEAMQTKDGLILAKSLLDQFDLLLKGAKLLKVVSLEALVYEANDGVDMLSALAMMLDEFLQVARDDPSYYQTVVSFVDAYLKVFTQTSEQVEAMLYYEQATAYIGLHSSKGEQIFKHLLKTYRDVTDVVLHYGLAYLDDDENRTLRIFKRYQHLLNKESDAYEVIQSIIQDCIGVV